MSKQITGRISPKGTGKLASSHLAPFVTLLACVCLTIPAMAGETMRSALTHAYRSSPELQAERYQLRAVDEQLPQAQSGWKPTVEASATVGYKYENSDKNGQKDGDLQGFKVTLRQPVFRGFRTENAVSQAHQVIAAEEQNVVRLEQDVLLKAVSAYMDVIRDRDIVRLRNNQVGILKQELRATRGRFSLGEVTRTDVAQATARYQSAIGNLENAKADLNISISAYLRFVGRSPRRLTRPGLPRNLPKSVEHGVRLAEQYHPEVKMAMHKEVAARHFVKVRRGDLLPRVALEAEYGYESGLSNTLGDTQEAVVRGVLTIPLYQAGTAHSRLREAKELASRRRMLILDARRKIRSELMRVWNRYTEASRRIGIIKAQVGAAMVAVEGVRREVLLGSRTTQETLDAERELMNTRIALAVARRDRIVRAYEVLSATGQLTAKRLSLGAN